MHLEHGPNTESRLFMQDPNVPAPADPAKTAGPAAAADGAENRAEGKAVKRRRARK